MTFDSDYRLNSAHCPSSAFDLFQISGRAISLSANETKISVKGDQFLKRNFAGLQNLQSLCQWSTYYLNWLWLLRFFALSMRRELFQLFSGHYCLDCTLMDLFFQNLFLAPVFDSDCQHWSQIFGRKLLSIAFERHWFLTLALANPSVNPFDFARIPLV